MNSRILSFFIFCLVWSQTSLAQNEIHFTQFQMAPVQLNPALIGGFEGTFRIGGIYRDQWFTAVSEGSSSFKTLDMFVDVNIIRGLRMQDWISAGLGYDALDQAGAIGLKNTFSRLGIAYHLANKKRTNIITLGVQRASKSTTINTISPEQARGPDGTDVNTANMSGTNMNGELEGDYSDWIFGLTYNMRGKETDFIVGVKAHQLFNPRFSIAGGSEQIEPLIAVFSRYQMPIGEKMSLAPSILYQTNGPASELVIQSRVGYGLNKDLAINGGLGLRTGDAIQILLGADYKQYQIGASYDINISNLSEATGGVGAFELALNYTGIIQKKPKPKPVILCPRL